MPGLTARDGWLTLKSALSGWVTIWRAESERNVKTSGCDSQEASDSYEPQLVLNELILPPGGEWLPRLAGWLVIYVSSGVGYWLDPRLNWELQTGAVVLLSEQIQGCIRASQVGELRLRFFRVEPTKLIGLVSLADQALMQSAARDEKLSLRLLSPDAQVADKLSELSSDQTRNTLAARVQLLQLFLELFGVKFPQPEADGAGVLDARDRLQDLLKQTPVAELLELSFARLVSQTRCSPRHASRLFTELVGVSFREKQAELRLARACDLLATTDSKVAEVALESGYQSTSLFNMKFKQRFSVSPAKWRAELKGNGRKPAKPMLRRLRLAA
jgi:AraC-like DNA-binding protein